MKPNFFYKVSMAFGLPGVILSFLSFALHWQGAAALIPLTLITFQYAFLGIAIVIDRKN